jgi:cold-inducible RNA-binding protein
MLKAELTALFAEFGPIRTVEVIMDRHRSELFGGDLSRGFGFVEFANPSDAQRAIAAMNGRVLEGRHLHVSEARPREPRTSLAD